MKKILPIMLFSALSCSATYATNDQTIDKSITTRTYHQVPKRRCKKFSLGTETMDNLADEQKEQPTAINETGIQVNPSTLQKGVQTRTVIDSIVNQIREQQFEIDVLKKNSKKYFAVIDFYQQLVGNYNANATRQEKYKFHAKNAQNFVVLKKSDYEFLLKTHPKSNVQEPNYREIELEKKEEEKPSKEQEWSIIQSVGGFFSNILKSDKKDG